MTLNNRTIKAYEYGDILATSSIAVNGLDTVKGSGELRLRTNGIVNINAGFILEQNGKLTISTGISALAKKSIYNNRPEQGSGLTIVVPEKTSFYTSHQSGILKVHYTVNKEAFVGVRFFDLCGRLVYKKQLGKKQPGYFTEIIDKKLCERSKIHIVELSTNQSTIVAKVIGMK